MNNEEEFPPLKAKGYRQLFSADYVDHLNTYERFYLKSPNIRKTPLRKKHRVYLKSLAQKIIKKNELFFQDEGENIEFFIINSPIPFHFSLPGEKIFLSKGLIVKYVQNESILSCILAFELVRTEKKIYNKVRIVPTGVMSTLRILSLLRIKTEQKVEVHKWA